MGHDRLDDIVNPDLFPRQLPKQNRARRNDAAAAIFYSPACYRARIVAMKDNAIHSAADEQNYLLASLSAALPNS